MSDEDEPVAWSTPFGELVFDDENPTDPDRRRRNNRALTIGIVVGAAVVLALGVVGVVLVGHYLDERSSLTATISAKYARAYRHCVTGGGDRVDCATRAEAACATDPGWSALRGDAARLREIGDACLFGPDAGP